MPTKPGELVVALQAHHGFRFSSAFVWGTAPFRPDDEVYTLVSARAAGERLELQVKDGAGEALTVSLDAPTNLKASADEPGEVAREEVAHRDCALPTCW